MIRPALLRQPPGLRGFGDPPRPVLVRRHAAARTMRLTVDPRDGAVRLTLPPRAAVPRALAWVESKRDWIEAQLAGLPAPRPFAPGTVIPLGDAELLVDWSTAHGRGVRREGGRLLVGGPDDLVNGRVLRWLKAEALRLLAAETHAWAERAGVTVASVAVGDPRARWGSCAADGSIRYSWRLVMAPDAVREATVVHEVAHRLHMHHGPEFHAAVRRLLGRDPVEERRWLAREGSRLYWLGRAS